MASESALMRPAYVDQWERVQRWYQRLYDLENESTDTRDTNYHFDVAHSFFQDCYHLRDWLVCSGVVSKSDLDLMIYESVELGICRNICNVMKHSSITRPGNNPDTHTFAYDTAEGGRWAITREYIYPELRERPNIEWVMTVMAGGKIYRCIDLASTCIKQWQAFLLERNLVNQNT